ncbi:MAG: DoxX family protein [Chloroflexi bacterium]|nr:DoxX family protein [Chloroflexota bacterium]MCI0727303.1 DoxX family protein [Chloroflexota bacterium]
MNIALWIVQILLAIVFLMAGVTKITQPTEKLVERGMGFVEDFSPNTIRLIGVLEVLGAIGVVLPALTGILPWLTPLAAVGLALTMVGAALTHLRRGEYPNIIANVILFALTVFVAYGQFVLIPL